MSRQRGMLIQDQVRQAQHMQKSMTQMKVRLENVLSGITGVTGQKIIRTILAGARDPFELAKLRYRTVEASEATIAKSPQGNWRPGRLSALRQAVELYDACEHALHECGLQVEAALTRPARHEAPQGMPDLDAALFRVCGVDVTRIDGIGAEAVLKIIAALGVDLSRSPSVKHFVSWLGVCPWPNIAGGKGLSRASWRLANPAAQVLRLAPMSLRKSQTRVVIVAALDAWLA